MYTVDWITGLTVDFKFTQKIGGHGLGRAYDHVKAYG